MKNRTRNLISVLKSKAQGYAPLHVNSDCVPCRLKRVEQFVEPQEPVEPREPKELS